MSTIEIHDLPENTNLDRKAMSAVRGGMSSMIRAIPGEPIRWTPGEPVRSIPSDPIRPISSNIGLLP
jgi:hypothetical protein